jgi:hypothetical protein
MRLGKAVKAGYDEHSNACFKRVQLTSLVVMA